ncbi:tRNA uridine-5-carboxymethylaminomethyl(34) synthesis GTPase MnmE [Candidatus Woesearchaeota archaeon]|nr:MAG: tRNA uridine-5-carboxymethylaminomethyl(34) synthesis GTPase MnmE [Candidatus Woesearchaeota archaeon]
MGLEDTITAISTPIGISGIGIIRISGKESLKIADKIFISKDKKRPSEFKTHTLHYGWIIDRPQTTNHRLQKRNKKQTTDIIDEVLLSVMRAPKSYTKEDVVEINCHGGIVSMRKILDLTLRAGARLAEPGEFTKRAFLNGRIDLTQAEAVLDIINAKTEASLKIAMNHLKGDLSSKIEGIRESLIDIVSHLEASIDFIEEGIELIDSSSLKERVVGYRRDLKKLLDTSEQGIILTEGITTVICGKANVGKSSLMNALIKKEKVIVTPKAGTTRDAIEELINLKGIPLRLIDTAGILEPKDVAEEESIARSRDYFKNADLVIFMLDNNEGITKEDIDIINQIQDKKAIVVINKIDLPSKIDLERIEEFLKNKPIVRTSVLKRINLERIEEVITKVVFGGETQSCQEPIINNLRHKEAIRDAYNHLTNTLSSINKNLSIEFIVEDIKQAVRDLERITGRMAPEEVLDRIFSRFCIGK